MMLSRLPGFKATLLSTKPTHPFSKTIIIPRPPSFFNQTRSVNSATNPGENDSKKQKNVDQDPQSSTKKEKPKIKPTILDPNSEPKRRYKKLEPRKKETLETYLKVKDMEQLPVEEISSTWRQLMEYLNCLAAEVQPQTFQKMKTRLQDSPLFIFPMPTGDRHTTVFVRAETNYATNTMAVFFKRLSEHQEIGVKSKPFLTLQFFNDFQESKRIILMRGKYGENRGEFNDDVIKKMLLLWQAFIFDDKMYRTMWLFNHESRKFNFDEVLDMVKIVVPKSTLIKKKEADAPFTFEPLLKEEKKVKVWTRPTSPDDEE